MAQLALTIGLTVAENEMVALQSAGDGVVVLLVVLDDLLQANKTVSNNKVLPMKSLFMWMYLAFE